VSAGPAADVRAALEARQVRIYFAAVAAAAVLGWLWPSAAALSAAIEPLLALMLFATFLQVPLTELRQALTGIRFVLVLLAGNFLVVPVFVAVLLPWLPPDPLVRVGVLLVLLTPCIDYVVTFAHLGRADARSLLAATPVLLACQMLALPLYLGLFLGGQATGLVHAGPFLHAFAWLIVVPLVLAGLCQAWAGRHAAGRRVAGRLGLLPVPATAAVLFVVVASVVPQLGQATQAVWAVAPIYVAFGIAAPLLGWALGRAARLSAGQSRAAAFSMATRNSLVVLPLGLAVPGAMPVVPAVIVTQTLVELACGLAYIRLLPRLGAKTGTSLPS
jgi:ACR3 family arsenite efflux pump ArsB